MSTVMYDHFTEKMKVLYAQETVKAQEAAKVVNADTFTWTTTVGAAVPHAKLSVLTQATTITSPSIMALDGDRLLELAVHALDYVNYVRTEHLMAPPLDMLPRGAVASSTDCVIARALMAQGRNVRVGGAGVEMTYDDMQYRVPIPYEVRLFLAAFDHGRYPELSLAA